MSRAMAAAPPQGFLCDLIAGHDASSAWLEISFSVYLPIPSLSTLLISERRRLQLRFPTVINVS